MGSSEYCVISIIISNCIILGEVTDLLKFFSLKHFSKRIVRIIDNDSFSFVTEQTG